MAPRKNNPFDKNLIYLAENNSKEVYEKCIIILKKILDNIIKEPMNHTFRSFRLENKTIKDNLLVAKGIEEVLNCIGFYKLGAKFELIEKADINVIKQWRLFLDFDFQSIDEIKENESEKEPLKPESSKPYLSRITFPRKLKTLNPFLQNLEDLSDHVMQYEDEKLKEFAKSIIPIDDLTYKATNKLFQMQQAKIEKEPCIRDILIVELTKWFNEEFFEWVNTVPCSICGREDYPEKSMRFENGNRVEVGFCCGAETKFTRFNDVADLMVSRKGRCGEYANCFTFFCRALDYKARWVTSQFDHVWTEIYSENQKRWIHIDPSDNVIDAPLMYQHGWKRTIDYVFAFSREDIQDVTWRYTSNHKSAKRLRQKCSEDELQRAIIQIRQKRQSILSEIERKESSYLTLSELIELMIERAPTENELKGRSSGNMSWKLERGESSISNQNSMSFQALDEEIDKKQFNLRYHCSSDKYERYIKESNGSINIISTYDTWEACQFSSVNIFRKVEKDWKMAYLARNENSNFAEITWKFDFGSSNLVIKEYSIRFDKQTYENGNVQLEIVPDNKSLNVKGSSAFTIKANLSGGKGDCAWQHSQLFRQPLSSKDFPFDLCVEFE